MISANESTLFNAMQNHQYYILVVYFLVKNLNKYSRKEDKRITL